MNTKIFVIGLGPNAFIGRTNPCISKVNGHQKNNRLDELEKEVKALKERVNDLELEQEANLDFDDFKDPLNFGCDEPNGDMRFGAAFAIDEPRASDYEDKDDFLVAREAFDDFVDAGEHCEELGLARPSWAKEHRCNAIRKRVGELPPMGVNLIGETEWWDENPCDCECWWL